MERKSETRSGYFQDKLSYLFPATGEALFRNKVEKRMDLLSTAYELEDDRPYSLDEPLVSYDVVDTWKHAEDYVLVEQEAVTRTNNEVFVTLPFSEETGASRLSFKLLQRIIQPPRSADHHHDIGGPGCDTTYGYNSGGNFYVLNSNFQISEDEPFGKFSLARAEVTFLEQFTVRQYLTGEVEKILKSNKHVHPANWSRPDVFLGQFPATVVRLGDLPVG